MATLTVSPATGYSSPGIQKAFDKCGSVDGRELAYSEIKFLEGTYLINSRMYLNSETKISCEGKVIFKLAPNLPTSIFGLQVPIIGQRESEIFGLDLSGIYFDGNYKNQSKTKNDHGLGYFNFVGLNNVADSKFHDFSGGYNEGDYFRMSVGSNLEFYNNTCEYGGHDHIHLDRIDYSKIYNNLTKMRSNNALRTRSCHHIEIYNNKIMGTNQAYAPGYQFESITPNYTSFDIDCHDNYFIDIYGPAIWFLATVPNTYDLRIHNNLILNCGQMPAATRISGVGGIVGDGWDKVAIENNTIRGCYGYGIGFANYQSQSTLSGYHATVSKNIIMDTKKSFYPGSQSGSPIANLFGSRWEVVTDENCIFGNVGKCYGVTSTNEILQNPLFVDPANGDYHLQSVAGHYTSSGYVVDMATSPCLLSGYELGRYGATKECSIYPANPRPGLQILFENETDTLLFLENVRNAGYLSGTETVSFINMKEPEVNENQ